MIELFISSLMTTEHLALLEALTVILKFLAALCGGVASVVLLVTRIRRWTRRRRRTDRTAR
ncbi:hypothetical protein ACWT_2410 [Actinoplanes sp. SE50]|uniref:hypothetical protein n=1 Tax=unclassified Actinoplanes TaxID=2626549 RepID=UPI00023EBB60|nr:MULTISPECIES: hypothetical protein [unclassified Actinoplanes]AEV83432.1 hypothetical protein ACPL_2537 [Actinoplanes sp. SE50/110]ATO81825.1 hypothetical protein ACWT_2410 [Actinoplanes sp. SE50]SLL99233.1 hypothetical protein ACSP50_2464 [Actinoplanes sp. SE50/110]